MDEVSGVSGVSVSPWHGRIEPHISWPRPATPARMQPIWAGEFRDHANWVSFAAKRLTGTRHAYGHEVPAICVDAFGRRCVCGGDFARARDEGAFPVRFFWEMEVVPETDQRQGVHAPWHEVLDGAEIILHDQPQQRPGFDTLLDFAFDNMGLAHGSTVPERRLKLAMRAAIYLMAALAAQHLDGTAKR
jgi:hypothetical protein